MEYNELYYKLCAVVTQTKQYSFLALKWIALKFDSEKIDT